MELSSGAIRNHRPDVMKKAFAIAGYTTKSVLEQKFGGMLHALSLGAPPHGGIAPGIDRIVMLLCGEDNLREVVLFPMNQQRRGFVDGRALGSHRRGNCASFTSASFRPAQPAATLCCGLFRGRQRCRFVAQRGGDRVKLRVHPLAAHQPQHEAQLAQDVEREPVAAAERAGDLERLALVAPPALGERRSRASRLRPRQHRGARAEARSHVPACCGPRRNSRARLSA